MDVEDVHNRSQLRVQTVQTCPTETRAAAGGQPESLQISTSVLTKNEDAVTFSRRTVWSWWGVEPRGPRTQALKEQQLKTKHTHTHTLKAAERRLTPAHKHTNIKSYYTFMTVQQEQERRKH